MERGGPRHRPLMAVKIDILRKFHVLKQTLARFSNSRPRCRSPPRPGRWGPLEARISVRAQPISSMCRAPEQLRVQPLLAADAPEKKNFPLPPLTRLNHNVALLLLMRIVSGLHTSLWSGTVLASYLYVLMGSNAYAGYVEAAMGIANMVFALPAGYLADRFSRSSVIAVGGWCVPLAAGLTGTAVIIGVQRKEQPTRALLFGTNITGSGTPGLSPELQLPFWLFVAALATWGFVQAVQNGAAQALFADSVLAGERSRFYMYSFVVFLVASVLGPIVSILIFVIHGNDWELTTLRNVFLAGMAVSLPNWVIMSFFSDKKMLDEEAPADAPAAAAVASSADGGQGPAGNGRARRHRAEEDGRARGHEAEGDGRARRLSRGGEASPGDGWEEDDSNPRQVARSRCAARYQRGYYIPAHPCLHFCIDFSHKSGRVGGRRQQSSLGGAFTVRRLVFTGGLLLPHASHTSLPQIFWPSHSAFVRKKANAL